MINVGKVREGEQINVLCCIHGMYIVSCFYCFVLNDKISVTDILVKKTIYNGLKQSGVYISYDTAHLDLPDIRMYTHNAFRHHTYTHTVYTLME